MSERGLAFGQLVRERRRALDLTQEELARRVGCAPVTLRKIEYGDMRPSAQVAERLAMALAVPLDERPAFVRQARAVRRAERRAESPPASVPDAPLDLADLSGRAIRGYQLGPQLGRGGFGIVYRAVQPGVEREVAIKAILPQYADQPDFVRRFEAEAQLVARLEHPHIVPLYDYWREPGAAFLVMRYLRGGSLSALLKQGPPTVEHTRRMVEQLSAALSVAHRAGVVHRDLKPANVMLDEEGNAYLGDFGIAKDLRRPSEVSFAGAFVGSPAYSSPEQLRAEPVSPQTDIYALGVLIFELLTGQKPFRGPTPVLLAQQHLNEPVPALASRRAGLTPALDQVVQRAMAKVATARYSDVRELAAALAAATAPEPGAVAVPMRPPQAAPPTEVLGLSDADTPYVGLRPFDAGDAARFFGRESLIQQLLVRLGENGELGRFLGVIGPSGSGKSSVVRAGLIPALRTGALPGSEEWYIVTVVPGATPLTSLAEALTALAPAGMDAEGMRILLRADERGLLRAARLVLPPEGTAELVVVIDQFEELFTLCPDERVRQHLLDSIVTAVLDEGSRLRIIVTLRADLLDRPLQYVDLGELLHQRGELVLAMTPDELEQAILGPARRAGLVLEAGLTTTLVGDVATRPGALPLLQHALSELFLRRQGRVLTRAAYEAIGGVSGALAGSAEAIYTKLTPAEQGRARQLFLRLVTPGESSDDLRRRVRQSELAALGAGAAVSAFSQARLLTLDRDERTREPTVEVAHEALLRAWPRLRGWVEGAREELLTQRRLAHAAEEWARAGRDASFLASGARLAQFAALAEGGSVELTGEERAFVATSEDNATRIEAAEGERQVRELETQRTAARRLRFLVGALAIFLVIALVLSTLAFQQRGEAEANFIRAEAQRLAAEANQIITRRGNSETAALLALRSINLGYTPQGDEALGAATGLEFAQQILAGPAVVIQDAVWSPDGSSIYTIGDDQTIRKWDAATGREQLSSGVSGAAARIAVAPEGGLLAVGRADGSVELRNLDTLEMLGTLEALSGEVLTLAFSAQERQLLVAGADPTVQLWDVPSRQLLRQLPHPVNAPAGDLSPDGRIAVTGDFSGVLRIWDLSTEAQPREWQAHTGDIIALALGSDGREVLSASYDGTAFLWDLTSGTARFAMPHRDSVLGADFAPDGRRLATVGTDLVVHLWEAATGMELQSYSGHNGNLFSVRFSADSQLLVTSSFDGTARVFAVAPQGLPQFRGHPKGVNSAALAPDGMTVLTGDRTGTLRLWNAVSGAQRWEIQAHDNEIAEIAFLPGGAQALTTSTDGTLRVWRVADGAEVRSIPKGTNLLSSDGFGLSPDGKLVFASSDQGAQLWDVETGQPLWQAEGSPFSAVFTPDGAAVIAVNPSGSPDGGHVSIRESASGALIHDFAPNVGHAVFGLAITPDGKYFATGSDDGLIQLWEYGTWREVGRFVGHTDIPWKLVFSSDGRQLLSAGLDRTARLWDTASYQELRRFVHPQRLYNSIAFTPDGSRVFSASTDGTARMWDVALVDTIDGLCARLQRDFTPEERTQYSIPDDGPTCR